MSEQITKETVTTLGDTLPREIARVRDEILPLYEALGRSGAFGAAMIRLDLDAAAVAMAEQDTVAMLRLYHVLRDTNG